MAKKRLESTISEMNVPSEDMMMKNPDLAPIALTKQASDFMKKFELTQAGTQFRRCREVLDRNLKTVLKRVHQQMSCWARSRSARGEPLGCSKSCSVIAVGYHNHPKVKDDKY